MVVVAVAVATASVRVLAVPEWGLPSCSRPKRKPPMPAKSSMKLNRAIHGQNNEETRKIKNLLRKPLGFRKRPGRNAELGWEELGFLFGLAPWW
jgi:hypothetical protein